jgi:hypothetical protein
MLAKMVMLSPYFTSFNSMRNEPQLHVQEAAVRVIQAQCSLLGGPSNESQGTANARPGPAPLKHVISWVQTSHVAVG